MTATFGWAVKRFSAYSGTISDVPYMRMIAASKRRRVSAVETTMVACARLPASVTPLSMAVPVWIEEAIAWPRRAGAIRRVIRLLELYAVSGRRVQERVLIAATSIRVMVMVHAGRTRREHRPGGDDRVHVDCVHCFLLPPRAAPLL